MNTAIRKIPSDKKVLIIEGCRMLLARNLDTLPQFPGGLKAYLQHCNSLPSNSLPSQEPEIQPYLEKVVREAYILDATNIADFGWEDFYKDRHGYQYLEHLREQFEKLDFEYVLIDVGPPPSENEDAFFLVGTYQLPDKVVWTDGSEEFQTFQLVLSVSDKEDFPTRVKSVITDAEQVLD